VLLADEGPEEGGVSVVASRHLCFIEKDEVRKTDRGVNGRIGVSGFDLKVFIK